MTQVAFSGVVAKTNEAFKPASNSMVDQLIQLLIRTTEASSKLVPIKTKMNLEIVTAKVQSDDGLMFSGGSIQNGISVAWGGKLTDLEVKGKGRSFKVTHPAGLLMGVGTLVLANELIPTPPGETRSYYGVYFQPTDSAFIAESTEVLWELFTQHLHEKGVKVLTSA